MPQKRNALYVTIVRGSFIQHIAVLQMKREEVAFRVTNTVAGPLEHDPGNVLN
jgi:hypothetical protein